MTEILKTIDANTGEKVSKCPINPDYQKEMEKVLNIHQNNLNTFMIMSQQVSELQAKWMDMRKTLTQTDEKFKTKMKYIAKKLKLGEHEPWTYNLTEKCFEMREPPDIQPLTAGQLTEKPDGVI